jgi:hypothetical protein
MPSLADISFVLLPWLLPKIWARRQKIAVNLRRYGPVIIGCTANLVFYVVVASLVLSTNGYEVIPAPFYVQIIILIVMITLSMLAARTPIMQELIELAFKQNVSNSAGKA